MNNIVFDEENPVTSDQLIWALFGKSTEDVARMFRDGKNGEYAYLFSVCSLSNLFFRFHTTTLTEACSNELKQHHL